MKKKKDISGLIFSAFLVIAFVVCSYFFIGLINSATNIEDTVRKLLTLTVFVVFGLVLFYATRVGDGKQIKRFSLATLLLLDLPALYIILAGVAKGIPFPFDTESSTEMIQLAAVALGYGVPYTFLSGYEIDIPDDSSTENEEEGASESDDEDKKNIDDDDISDSEETPANDSISETENVSESYDEPDSGHDGDME